MLQVAQFAVATNCNETQPAETSVFAHGTPAALATSTAESFLRTSVERDQVEAAAHGRHRVVTHCVRPPRLLTRQPARDDLFAHGTSVLLAALTTTRLASSPRSSTTLPSWTREIVTRVELTFLLEGF